MIEEEVGLDDLMCRGMWVYLVAGMMETGEMPEGVKLPSFGEPGECDVCSYSWSGEYKWHDGYGKHRAITGGVHKWRKCLQYCCDA